MVTLDAVQLYDMGFGPLMVSVAPPGVPIAPGSTLKDKALGKAPGKLTLSGWVGVDLNDPKTRCPDYKTAALWRDEWHANIGLAAGEGLVIIDNDQGAEFSRFLFDAFQAVGIEPLRRYVQDPKHKRDAWLFQVRDFIGEPVSLPNMNLGFRNGVMSAEVQLLAKGKQLVVSGVHPGTKGPYVLDRPLAFDQLPVLSEDQLKTVFEKFNTSIAQHGWTPVGAPVSPPVSRQGTIRNLIPSSKGLTQEQIDSAIASGAALLAHLPNREVPAGETPTKTDEWLNVHGNYAQVAYALIAHLGPAAHTPQARNLFLEWAMGRPQPGQNPDTPWTSALRQPLKSGGRSLTQLAQTHGTLPPTGFPDPDPNDPAFKVTPSMTPVIDELKREWAFITKGKGGFVHLKSRRLAEVRVFSLELLHLRDALKAELGIKKSLRPSVAELFCAQKDKLKFHDITFAAGDDPVLPDNVYNLWKPVAVPRVSVTAQMVKTWLDHAHFLLGSIKDELFVQWCAFVAQHPKLKPNWHWLIMTKQGLGKNMMMIPVMKAVGDGNWKESGIDVFADNFNEPLASKLMIISEVGNLHNNAQASKILRYFKPATAAPPFTIPINPKYGLKYEVPNRVATVMFSNEENPFPLERDQRRICVANRLKSRRKPDSYYADLDKWLDANGNLVAAYLLSYPLTDAHIKIFLGNAPSSDDKTELEERNVEPGLKLLEEIIDDARQGVGPFSAMLANAEGLASIIKARNINVTSPRVGHWLRDMEREGKGVGRLRIDPKRPGECAAIRDNKSGETARLWHLGEKSPDGRDWKSFTNAELLAMWHGRPAPARATVINFPKTVDGDERV